MRIGFASASATSAAVALAGDAVDGRAQPRLLALRAARLRRARVVRAGGEHERGGQRAPSAQRLRQDRRHTRGSSSRMRWLTTRLDPPGGIDTP